MTMLPRNSLPPQHLGGGKSRCAAADDDDLAGRIVGGLPRGLGCSRFCLDEDAAAVLLDLPARERTQRRRAHRFAAAQIEAGVMPGTADAVADHEPFGERSVIVAAMRVDGENLGARAHQQDILIADMAEQACHRRDRTSATPCVRSGPAGGACSCAIASPSRRCQVVTPREFLASRGLSRKQPSMRLVTRSVSGLCTPRVVMQ